MSAESMSPISKRQATKRSVTVRGQPTALSAVPKGWRGPLPDLSIEHSPEPKNGWAKVPLSLLHRRYQDLGVLVWAQLRLKFDGRADATSYLELASALGMDTGSPDALKVKLSLAVKPLLGTWIRRRSLPGNRYSYRALLPDPSERWAIIRRADIELIKSTRGTRMPCETSRSRRLRPLAA